MSAASLNGCIAANSWLAAAAELNCEKRVYADELPSVNYREWPLWNDQLEPAMENLHKHSLLTKRRERYFY